MAVTKQGHTCHAFLTHWRSYFHSLRLHSPLEFSTPSASPRCESRDFEWRLEAENWHLPVSIPFSILCGPLGPRISSFHSRFPFSIFSILAPWGLVGLPISSFHFHSPFSTLFRASRSRARPPSRAAAARATSASRATRTPQRRVGSVLLVSRRWRWVHTVALAQPEIQSATTGWRQTKLFELRGNPARLEELFALI